MPTETKISSRVAVPKSLLRRFREFYPDYGDFSTVTMKLIRAHIEELERRKASGEPITPFPISAAY